MKKKASLLCSVLLLSVVACHSGKIETDDTKSLKIGYLPSTDILPYVVAQQQGYYDSLGLDLKLMPMESGLNRDTLFQQKKTDGSILSPIEVIRQQVQGTSIIPTLANEGLYYIVASNDSNFTKPKQLREKTLSTVRESAYDFFVDKVLKQLEIGPDEINKPELGNESVRMQMLANTQIDAAVLREPYVSKALQDGCKIIASSASYPVTLSVTAFSDSILKTKETDIKKLINGYNLAVQYMNKHPQKEWLAKAATATGLSPIVQKLPPFKEASKPTVPHIREMIQWMQEKDFLPKSYPDSLPSHPLVEQLYQEAH